jgi:hypothetical protein
VSEALLLQFNLLMWELLIRAQRCRLLGLLQEHLERADLIVLTRNGAGSQHAGQGRGELEPIVSRHVATGMHSVVKQLRRLGVCPTSTAFDLQSALVSLFVVNAKVFSKLRSAD